MKRTLATLILALPCIAQAADLNQNGNAGRWFIGGGLGSSSFNDDGFSDDVSDDTGVNVKTEANDTALLLKFGYRFNRIVGIEASYIDYGQVDYKANNFNFMKLSLSSISVAANLGYTFNSGLRPFGMVGLSIVDVDADFAYGFSSESDTYTGVHFGFGGEYTPPGVPHLTLRVAYEGDLFIEDSLKDDLGYSEYAMDVGALNFAATFNF